MRHLTLALDSLPALRDATASSETGLGAAATLAQLAGVSALRLGLDEELKPVRQADVLELRHSASILELRMPPSPTLVKLALEARPECVVLCSGGREGPGTAGPVDLRGRDAALTPVLRSLEEAGIPSVAMVGPRLEAVKAAHGLGVSGVEFYTGTVVDLPQRERRAELEALGDAVRLASKLRLDIGISGGLGYGTVREVLETAAAAERVVCGRALVARSVLVGLDRAVRDFRALLA